MKKSELQSLAEIRLYYIKDAIESSTSTKEDLKSAIDRCLALADDIQEYLDEPEEEEEDE